MCDIKRRDREQERERWGHSGCDIGLWLVCGEVRWGEGGEGHRTHRGLTTSENRLGLKIKHYVIGVGV